MLEYDLAYAATLVTVAFCALMFSVLAVFFLRERRARRGSALAIFTLVCAAAFAANLLLTFEPRWVLPLAIALDLVTGAIPPLLLHLATEGRRSRVRTAFYAVSAAVAIAAVLEDAGTVAIPSIELAPGALLAAASAFFRQRNGGSGSGIGFCSR
jgi:hypothetical protein